MQSLFKFAFIAVFFIYIISRRFIGIPFFIVNNRKGGFLKAIQNRIEARGKVVFAAVLVKSSLEVRKHICVRF